MKAAAAALATIGAVPFSAFPFVHLVLFLLQAVSHEQVFEGPPSVLEREDVCKGASCAFSTLQQRAKGTRASGAASRGAASGRQRSTVDMGLEELDVLTKQANYSLQELMDGPCEDYDANCEQLAAKWWNCMGLDTSQVPRQPTKSLEPVAYLQTHCRKTCAWCGSEMYITRSELRLIRNDEVDKELSFARAGSAMPEALHGIFWMDQHGFNKEGWKCDPDFHYNFEENACNEILFTAGDGAEWDPKTKCLRGTAFTGRQGHWTYMNEGYSMGNRLFALNNAPQRMGGQFCMLDDEGLYWEIPVKTVPRDMTELLMWKTLGTADAQGFYTMPSWVLSFTMKKTCFGFARKSVAGPAEWAMKNGVLYYPIFQIVDGHGKKTEHWDAYINFTKTVYTHCKTGGIFGGKPCNIGDGTQLVPVMTKKKIDKWANTYPEIEYLKLFDTGRLADA